MTTSNQYESDRLPAIINPKKNPYDFRNPGKGVSYDHISDVGRVLGYDMFNQGDVFVGRDQRRGSTWVYDALKKGLRDVGCTVVTPGKFRGKKGMATTAMVAHHTRQEDFQGGVMGTASHMPGGYVGVKPFTKDGLYFDTEHMDQVRSAYQYYQDAVNGFPLSYGRGDEYSDDNALRKYLNDALTAYKDQHRGSALDDTDIVVDPGNGVGGISLPYVLRAAGANVTTINECLDGFPNPHRDPEPNDEAIDGLTAAVKEAEADMGFATDGDADRIRVVDRNGRKIPGHEILGHLGEAYVNNDRLPNGVVYSINTPRKIKEYVESLGGDVEYTPVGAIFTAKECLDENVGFGGQINGHITDGSSEKTPFADSSTFFSLKLAEILKESSDHKALQNRLPSFYYERRNHEIREEDVDEVFANLRRQIEDNVMCSPEAVIGDAYKFRCDIRGEEENVLLRQSGTQPIIRASVERDSPNGDSIHDFIDDAIRRAKQSRTVPDTL